MDTLTNPEGLLDQVDKTLKNWCVCTYLPKGTILRGGRVVAPEAAEQIAYHKPNNDRTMLQDTSPNHGKPETSLFFKLVSEHRQRDVFDPTLRKNVFVSQWKAEDDPQDSILAIGGVQAPTPADNRGSKTWIISLQMPSEVANDITSTIKEKPEFVDSVIKKIFPNLDAVDKNPISGLRRYKADTVKVIDINRFKELHPDPKQVVGLSNIQDILKETPALKLAQPIGEWD